MAKPDNTQRNASILELAGRGKPPAEIARELGLSRGVVLGVLHRARRAEAKVSPSAETERPQDAAVETLKPDDAGEGGQSPSAPLKAGDRVRVRAGVRLPKYSGGDKGAVSHGPQTSADGSTYYLLVMDKDDPPESVIFKAGEIEPDL